nr:MAG TPA: Transcription elongation factor Elf1 like [Caudoviricetes sp.]
MGLFAKLAKISDSEEKFGLKLYESKEDEDKDLEDEEDTEKLPEKKSKKKVKESDEEDDTDSDELDEEDDTDSDELDEEDEDTEDKIEEKQVKVVRDGKVVTRKVKTVKTKLTSKQKQALAKARKKAHTAGANKARKKSMAIHKKRLGEGEENCQCPYCGYEAPVNEFTQADGQLMCPDCTEIFTREDNTVSESRDYSKIISKEELNYILESKDTPNYIKEAYKEGRHDVVKRYLGRIM